MGSDTTTINRSQELLALKSEYLMPCVYHFYKEPPVLVRGEGCYLYDDQGNRYLDCLSGVAVMNAGHCNPEITGPAIEQATTLQHTTTIYLTEPILKLAEALARITPGDLKRSFFCASSSEAVEGALLTAVLHTGRPHIIATDNGLHGRTRWAMNATGMPMWRTDPCPMSGVSHVPFGDIDALADELEKYAGQVAAFIAEPIQSNGGINPPPEGYWQAVRELCDQHGVLLVMDEIQTGFNRTGRWFACEHFGVVPDVMTVSKAMGNGFPIAAFITTDEIAASYTRPGASTHGGNPVNAIAALAVIQYHERHGLGDKAQASGEYLLSMLNDIALQRGHLRPPRSRGLMVGLPVVDTSGLPDPERCDTILEALKDLRVLAGKSGPDRNVLTFMPPLIIERQEIGELAHAVHEATV
jgi:alanine-glyoxylate transaminase / (R)-3-amino-2-methylpropionate-pyruvate transaminase